uniref:Uncharacterized protein n=1 Tax=Sphaerodactylus townsendi TaxID=933632 RepID=A0ACB8G1B7_9SAUR
MAAEMQDDSTDAVLDGVTLESKGTRRSFLPSPERCLTLEVTRTPWTKRPLACCGVAMKRGNCQSVPDLPASLGQGRDFPWLTLLDEPRVVSSKQVPQLPASAFWRSRGGGGGG